MSTCILHVGMPKTGSSSIQDSLYLGLSDPKFQYINLSGHSNAAHFLEALFRDEPSQFWVYQRKGFSAEKVQRMRDSYDQKLRATLRRIRALRATAILSAETCWQFSPSQLNSLKAFLAEESIGIQIIVYLRPIKSWIESAFQENVKYKIGFVELKTIGEEILASRTNYLQKLNVFETIFGRDKIIVKPFSREALVGGCAVRDFCTTFAIPLNPEAIQRSNDSICADAVRMLYCYNRYARDAAPPSLADNHLILLHLAKLKGEPFRLHSSLIAPLYNHIAEQNQGILERYGVDIHENLQAADDGPCIRETSDLMRFSRYSLDWLADVSGGSVMSICEGEDTARAVAKQVAGILHRPAWGLRMKRLSRNVRFKLRGWRHGH